MPTRVIYWIWCGVASNNIESGLILNTGQSWDVNVTSSIFAPPGSNVTIPCVFTYPRQFYTNDVQVYWKRGERSEFDLNDQDKNAFVYHTNDTWVLKRYRGKTKIIGNKDKGNCSLMIQDVDQNDTNLYLRVIAKGNQYSFYGDSVSITLLCKKSSNTLKIFGERQWNDSLITFF